MKIVQDKTGKRVSSGLLEDICIPPSMVECTTVELIETIHLGKLTTLMRNKVVKSLRLGVHDARGGLSSLLYRTLCDMYKLPQSLVSADSVKVRGRTEPPLLSISAKDILIRNSRGSRAQSYYGNEDLTRGTIKVSVGNNLDEGYYLAHGYNCGIKRDELAHYVTKAYLEEHNDAVEAAISDIMNGEELVFKTITGATK